jgi:hypothetical protein
MQLEEQGDENVFLLDIEPLSLLESLECGIINKSAGQSGPAISLKLPTSDVWQQCKSDKSVQVDFNSRKELIALKSKMREIKRKKTLYERSVVHFEWLKKTPKKFYFYTGLTEAQFEVLFTFLGPEVSKLKLWRARSKKPIKMYERFQLALTLLRMRLGSPLTDLSYRFAIRLDTLGNLFITWTQFLFKMFSELRTKMFTSRLSHSPLPRSFRNPLLKNVRIVIDCTELIIESSSDFKQVGNLYSSYKSHTTAKILIGVAPGGAAMFCSDAYEGSISDREIVKKSGFLDHISSGDIVLADRGFTIEDLLAQKNATLVIPPFLKGRAEFTEEETVLTKIIAKARIHVERYNERIKNWRIISGVLPHHLTPLLSQIVFILCCLVNFQEPLLKI